METKTDILFAWTYAIGGNALIAYGVNTMYTRAGAGLFLMLMGLLFITVSYYSVDTTTIEG